MITYAMTTLAQFLQYKRYENEHALDCVFFVFEDNNAPSLYQRLF